MKVRVDQTLCTGNEICTQVCADVFEMRGNKAAVKITDIPEDLEGCCREAADSCPSEAIIIEE